MSWPTHYSNHNPCLCRSTCNVFHSCTLLYPVCLTRTQLICQQIPTASLHLADLRLPVTFLCPCWQLCISKLFNLIAHFYCIVLWYHQLRKYTTHCVSDHNTRPGLRLNSLFSLGRFLTQWSDREVSKWQPWHRYIWFKIIASMSGLILNSTKYDLRVIPTFFCQYAIVHVNTKLYITWMRRVCIPNHRVSPNICLTHLL